MDELKRRKITRRVRLETTRIAVAALPKSDELLSDVLRLLLTSGARIAKNAPAALGRHRFS